MTYARTAEFEASHWKARAAQKPEATGSSVVTILYFEQAMIARSSEKALDSEFRKKLIRSIRFGFLLGLILVLMMPVGFYLGGAWIGVLFVPPIFGAYGLFLSSGIQLRNLDRASYDPIDPLTATAEPLNWRQ